MNPPTNTANETQLTDITGLRQCGIFPTGKEPSIRPDLIGGATLEKIGSHTARTRQAVHKLADNFRVSMGMKS